MKVNETGEVFNEHLKAFTLELPDYRKMQESDCKTYIDYWLYNLANMETMTTAIPFQAERPIFSKVGNISELVNMTEQEREMYNISLDSYRTNLSVMKNERAEGREEKAIEMARNLKSLNIPIDTIVQATGLTTEQIENL